MDSSDAKLPLCQGRLCYHKSIVRRVWNSGKCISCVIEKYSDLESSVYCCLTQTISDTKFTVKVLKKPFAHFFQLHCKLPNIDMICRIMYDEIQPSEQIPVKQTEYGYWAEVPIEVVNDPRNKNLSSENTLVIQFYYEYNCAFTRVPLALCGRRTWRDEELFSQDMTNLFNIREKTGDLVIIAKGEKFPVHRFVFAARTTWFKSYPNSLNRNQICILGEPLLMNKVIRYMYCGKLEETDVGDMLYLLDIASTLGMTDLIQTASDALREMMTEDNAQKILRMATKLDNTYLMKYAKECLPEQETALEEKGRGQKGKKKRH